MKVFYKTLDQKRTAILPFLAGFKKEFYLAGGTALALQIGHRISIDFDFFSPQEINTREIFTRFEKKFGAKSLKKILEDKDTLTFILYENIKISFFAYPYPILKLLTTKYFSLASTEDIACMKFSAITGRSETKDYVDLYFILQKIALKKLLRLSRKKYPGLDQNLILKSLIYFEDIQEEPIFYTKDKAITFSEIQNFLRETVKKL